MLQVFKFNHLFVFPGKQKGPEVHLACVYENVRLSDRPTNEEILYLFLSGYFEVPETIVGADAFG